MLPFTLQYNGCLDHHGVFLLQYRNFLGFIVYSSLVKNFLKWTLNEVPCLTVKYILTIYFIDFFCSKKNIE